MSAADGLRQLLENDAKRAKLTRAERAAVRAALAALERKHATFRPSELPVFGPCGLGPMIVHHTGEPDTLINRCPRCADSRQSNAVLAARHYEDICAEFLGMPDPTARDEYDVRCNACGHVYTVDTGARS